MHQTTSNLLRTSAPILLAAFLSSAEALSAESESPSRPTPAQIIAALPEPTPFAPVSLQAHSTLWERTVYEPSPEGTPTPKTQRIVELGTGLNYKNPSGQWVPAREIIEPIAGGAAAVQGQTKVSFANNLVDAWPIQIQTPDEKLIKTRVLGLTLSDHTGKSVWLGQVKDSQGYISDDSTVIYPDCMSDILCSIRLRYTRAGIEQDLIIGESLEGLRPGDIGLDPATSVIALVTEFSSAETTVVAPSPDSNSRPDLLADSTIQIGPMRMGPGKAWFMRANAERPIPVFKQWLQQDGRKFLFEQLPMTQAAEELDRLPRNQGASISSRSNILVTSTRTFPEPRLPAHQDRRPMQFARNQTAPQLLAALNPSASFVWDYQLMASSATNFTFEGNVTFLISSAVNLAGVTRLQGSSVIKFGTSSTAGINTTNIICETGPYLPVILTAVDDNTCGETISGNNPFARFYGGTGLNLSGAPSGLVLSNVFISHLSNAVAGAGIVLRDCQINRCLNAFASGSTSPILENVLLNQLGWFLPNASAATVTGSHVTAHNVTNFLANTTGTINLTNSLFAAVNSWQCSTTRTNTSAFLTSDTDVFQTVGGASHYLPEGSPFKEAGTVTGLSPDLLSRIRQKTSTPPLVYSNAQFTVDTTFNPSARRNTGPPDLGYLYDPLDHVFGGCHALANITFTPGTAVGWFRTSSGWYHAGHGIRMGDQKVASFAGLAQSPCFWVRTTVVQERLNSAWAGGYGPGGITGWTDQNMYNISLSPEVRLNFTKCMMLANDGNHFRDDWGYIIVRAINSELWSGGFLGYINSIFFTNCLFGYSSCGNIEGWPGTQASIRNCTFIRGELNITPHTASLPVTIMDTAFDNTRIYFYGTISIQSVDYNAYRTGTNRISPQGTYDKLVTSYNWQAGSMGGYYLPTNSTLIDAGSTTANAIGLYHFTSTTNQVKETNSVLNIGYHYIATGTNGLPADSDRDGIPDYFEDANGNGNFDTGETGWQSYNSANGLSTSDGLHVFTPFKP